MKGKRFALVVTALAFLLVASIPSNASDYVTGRETVTITSGTCDINVTNSNLYNVTAGTNVTGNLTLPCQISELDNVTLIVYNGNASSVTVNFTVNGVKLIDTQTIASGANITKYLSDYTTGGGNTTLTYFNWSGNCTGGDVWFNITIIADDANISNINTFVTVTEKVNTNPHISLNKDDTWYSVTDRIAFTNSLIYNLTDINISFSYPYQALNPSDTYVVFDAVAYNSTGYKYVSYQKQGPYVKSIGVPTRNSFGEYELTMRVKAYEDESDVTWTIDPTSDEWKDYFPQLDINSLEIYINDEQVEFTVGSIYIENIELEDGLNDVYMKWTPAQEPTPPVTEAEGYSIYVVFGIIIVALILIVLLLMTIYKR